MAGVEVPISLPTDSASVKAAAAVVKSLDGAMRALGPAAQAGTGQATAQMRALTAAAQAARKQVDAARAGDAVRASFGRTPARSGEEAKAREAAVKAAEQAEKKAQATTKEHESVFSSMAASGAAAFGKVAVAAYAFAAAASAAFIVALVKVQAFKEGAAGALTKLLGSAGAAQSAIAKAVAMSGKIGVGVKDAVTGVNQLVAKGFGADQALELVKAMADLKAVVPDANIGNLLLAITQIKSKGVLQMEELQGQIAEAGLSVSVVLEEIGKKIGKSAADVRKMIAAGKISADQGVQGILAAIQKTTGKPLGKAAEDAANSLGGLLARLEDLPTALLFAADASKGMGAIKSVLANVLGAFAPGSKSGDMLAASLGRLGDAFMRVIEPLTGKGGADTFAKFAEGASKAIDQVAQVVANIGDLFGPAIKGLLDGLGAGLKLGSSLDGITKNPEGMKAAGEALGKIARALGFIAGLAFEGVLGAIDKVASVQAAWGSMGQWLTSLPGVILGAISGAAQTVYQGALSIGSNLVQGIIAGITGGLPGLLGVIAQLASTTTGAAQAGYQIKSPSRLWEKDVGIPLPAGEAKGIEKGTPLVNRAIRRHAAATTGTAVGGAGGAGTTAGNGRTVVIEGGIHFHGMTRSDAGFFDDRMRGLLTEWGAT